MTTADVEVAAKKAFEQLHARMLVALGPENTFTNIENVRSVAETLKLEGCCSMLTAMDAASVNLSESHQVHLGPKLSSIAHATLKHDWCTHTLR